MWKCNRCGHANWMRLDSSQEDTCAVCGKLRLRNRTQIIDKGFGFFRFRTTPWRGYWSKKAGACLERE